VPPPRPDKTAEAVARLGRSIASFSVNGFRVVSVNRSSEIPRLRASFPDLTLVEATNEGLFAGRYGPSFASLFAACQSGRFCAVLNADVYLVKSRIAAIVEDNAAKFLVARRADIVDYDKRYIGTYTRGIDAFFFAPERCSALMEDPDIALLQLGAPMWDITLPVVASFHSPLEFIEPPFILHPVHKASWSRPDYERLRLFCAEAILRHARAAASRSVTARQFLHVIEGQLGPIRNISRDKEAKLFMRLANFWLQRIEIAHSMKVEVDRNDPVLRAATSGLNFDFAALITKESLPESREHRWPLPIEMARVGLSRWKRALRTKRWNRLFDEAEHRFAQR
jgi:hypothetical protein